uniref:Protein kinase domain-containing protein n=2 Tax=Ditylum brightwellii TaxID=49249 RepID=A0A6V2L7G4_9STRA
MQLDRNTDYPTSNEGHQPIDFPEYHSTSAKRITVLGGVTDENIVYTRTGDDDDVSDERYMTDTDDDNDSMDEDDDDKDHEKLCIVVIQDDEGNSQNVGYLLKRVLKTAIYGRVRYALVVRKRQTENAATPADAPVAWDVTGERCAVKEMSWTVIRELRCRCEEDPVKEVKAMQLIQRHHQQTNPNRTIGEAMIGSKVMPSRDILDDGDYLYSVMPFCDGGEFFDYLFNEDDGNAMIIGENEARRYFLQILEGIETMQNAGVTHRDMSLENLMIHDHNCLVIDMGMALRIPYENVADIDGEIPPNERGERFLVAPQGRCGKIRYMSPEIFRNRRPFDGHAVDLWAVGVILFMMVTGIPPWDRPSAVDARFLHICRRALLEQICVNWGLDLSRPLMDLLQRMFYENPTERLSLEQIRAHSWTNGEA